jgi:uncharacterized membrane protein HdeD (DUF308 family)
MTAVTAKNSNAWIWTVVRGLFALVVGIYLLAGANAPELVVYALAAYLTIAGALQTFSGLFNRDVAGSSTDRIRGLVGLIGGLALLLLVYFNVVSQGTAYTILAILLIAYGVLGLFEAFFDRGPERFRWMPVIVNLLLAALGVLVFYFRSRELDLKVWGGVILSLIGLAALAYAFLIQKKNPRASADV